MAQGKPPRCTVHSTLALSRGQVLQTLPSSTGSMLLEPCWALESLPLGGLSSHTRPVLSADLLPVPFLTLKGLLSQLQCNQYVIGCFLSVSFARLQHSVDCLTSTVLHTL